MRQRSRQKSKSMHVYFVHRKHPKVDKPARLTIIFFCCFVYTRVSAFVSYFMNQSQIKAQYTPGTPLFEFWLSKLGSRKWLFLKKYKCYKVSWGLKITATQYSTISLSVSKVERVLFHPLSSRFLKENQFSGGSCDGFFGFFGSKCALGSQKHVEEVSEVSQGFWQFPKAITEPTLSNLPPTTKAVSNPATRWRSSTPNSCKTLLVSTWTKV